MYKFAMFVPAAVAALLIGCSSHDETCEKITQNMLGNNIMAFSSYGALEDPRVLLTFLQSEIVSVSYDGGSKDEANHCDGIAEVEYKTKSGDTESVTVSVVVDYDEIGDTIRWRNTDISIL